MMKSLFGVGVVVSVVTYVFVPLVVVVMVIKIVVEFISVSSEVVDMN